MIHYVLLWSFADRRSVFVNMRTHIPEKLLQINSATRTILATNKNKFLKIYLYFTEPVMNSSAEILNAIDLNQGSLVPISGSSRGQRRFGYQVCYHLSGLYKYDKCFYTPVALCNSSAFSDGISWSLLTVFTEQY